MIKLILCLLVLVFALTMSICLILLMLSPIVSGFKRAPYVPSFNYHLKLMKEKLKLRK
ncbi:MAG: hypothetical protein WCG98_10470 [bacterium]